MHRQYEQAAALTAEVIEAAVAVQRHFGIGVLESIYVKCLERELQLRGHATSREKRIVVSYRGLTFDECLRYDLLVDDCLVVEAKACEKENMEIWRMQLLSYLTLMDKPLGLVINFGNQSLPRRGIRRVILKGADAMEEGTQVLRTRGVGKDSFAFAPANTRDGKACLCPPTRKDGLP